MANIFDTSLVTVTPVRNCKFTAEVLHIDGTSVQDTSTLVKLNYVTISLFDSDTTKYGSSEEFNIIFTSGLVNGYNIMIKPLTVEFWCHKVNQTISLNYPDIKDQFNMTVNDFFTSVEPALTFLPDDENCWSDTIFSVEVSPGATVPDQLLTVELDDIGVFSFTVDSVDQVGDHLISITASDGLLTSANSTRVFSVHVESPNALPDLCQDASSLYLEEKENEQAADLPDEAIEITVG